MRKDMTNTNEIFHPRFKIQNEIIIKRKSTNDKQGIDISKVETLTSEKIIFVKVNEDVSFMEASIFVMFGSLLLYDQLTYSTFLRVYVKFH